MQLFHLLVSVFVSYFKVEWRVWKYSHLSTLIFIFQAVFKPSACFFLVFEQLEEVEFRRPSLFGSEWNPQQFELSTVINDIYETSACYFMTPSSVSSDVRIDVA